MTLTSEQLSVVNLVSGRHLVLAPPGSGKTEMLSQRIIRALGAGVDPKKMLCATFTNRAAFEMRDRVAGVAGQDFKLPDVGNLHHFCHRFLLSVRRLHPGKHVLDESQQLDFIHEVTDGLREEPNEIVEEYIADCEEDDRSPYPDILSAVLISYQWRLGIPACYLRQVPPQMHELVECGVIAALERAYTGLKRKFQSVDFDDLVNETFLYLTKNPLDDDRRFDWIQIDEVQDLNPLQWRIVKELTSTRAVSVYFGDVEQSIFSFLGASASAFDSAVADFKRHYFKANFRATPLLLEVLMRFSLDALRSEWEFLPVPSDVTRMNGEVSLSPFGSPKAIMEKVRHLLGGGIAENVAILVRTNREADDCERLVRGLGYRTVKESGRDLFAYPLMRDFLSFVSLFVEKPSRTAWASLVRRFADGICRSSTARYFVRGMFAAGWDPRQLFDARDPVPSIPHVWDRSRQWAWQNRRALSSLRKRLKPAYDAIVPRLGRRTDFRSVLAAFSKVALGNPMRYSILGLVPEKKTMETELHRELTEDEAREYALRRVELFFRYVEHVYKNDRRPFAQVLTEDWPTLSKLKEADLLVGDEKVVISTVHKAKGRQFDAVIVPGVEEMSRSGMGSDSEEALRLVYVAMSRAKRHLSLMDCGPGGVWQNLVECFRADYAGYYLRRSRGDDLSCDWLCQWECLAKANGEGRCPMELVEPALVSKADAVVRMALKTLRHHPSPDESRRRWLGFLTGDFAETAIGCLRVARVYDSEVVGCVRQTALISRKERDHHAALEYFKSGLQIAPERQTELLAAIGDFVYHRSGTLRLNAATCLVAQGIVRWNGVIRGASTDFVRLESAADAEHEETIRAILAKKDLPEEYERRLRMIIFARAKRNPKD